MTITGTIKDEFIISKQGKRFVLAGGLLDAAHRAFDTFSIETDLILPGTPETGNVWIVRAKVTCPNGVFVQMGDASAENVGPMVKTRLVAMAETRAVTRALRLAVNAAALAPFDDPDEDDDARPAPTRPFDDAQRFPTDGERERRERAGATRQAEPAKPLASPDHKPPPAPAPPRAGPASFPPTRATDSQLRAIVTLAGRQGTSERELDAESLARYGAVVADLTAPDAASMIKALQAKEVAPAERDTTRRLATRAGLDAS